METILLIGVFVLSCVVFVQQRKLRRMYLESRFNQSLFGFITKLTTCVESIHAMHVYVPKPYCDERVESYEFAPIGVLHLPRMSFSVFVEMNCGERYFIGVIEVDQQDLQDTDLKTSKLFPLLFSKIDKELMNQVWQHEREC